MHYLSFALGNWHEKCETCLVAGHNEQCLTVTASHNIISKPTNNAPFILPTDLKVIFITGCMNAVCHLVSYLGIWCGNFHFKSDVVPEWFMVLLLC